MPNAKTKTELFQQDQRTLDMNEIEKFSGVVADNIRKIGEDASFLGFSNVWIRECIRKNYAHNFSWFGRPIIQIPQDIYAIQEIIWKCKPDLVIETGIAHGGSLILSASLLAMLDYCDAMESGTTIDPHKSKRKVIGVDIDIRSHNRAALESHPLYHKLQLFEGSSIDENMIERVKSAADGYERIVVFLDSNHTHEHVLAELEAYAPFTSANSYCVVWDTGVEDLPASFITDRPWGKGNNPKTAVWEYLERLKSEGRGGVDGNKLVFEIDKTIEHKIVLTASSDGFLRRVSG